MGAWVSYGLGSMNKNLPDFIVLMTKGNEGGFSRLYSNGFLPPEHEGVQFRSGKNPVLYLSNPPGVSDSLRREQLDYLKQMQSEGMEQWNDPEIAIEWPLSGLPILSAKDEVQPLLKNIELEFTY